MRYKIKSIFWVMCFLLFPFTSFAAVEIKSENITFYGDVKAEDGQRLVQKLETYRAFILNLTGTENRRDPVPLKIYAFKNESALAKFAKLKNIAGLYTEGADGPVFLTVSKGGFKDNKWSSQVALHEFSHHVLHALSEDNFPRWYDEGFANYLSTFEIDGDVITIGAPKVTHARAMKSLGWMDIEKVLGAIDRYPSSRRLDRFYGQSWLYVHYLQNTPELSAKLPDYLNLLKTQNDPLKAFETAFGLTVEDFQKKTRLYWVKDAFPVASFKASKKLLEHEMVVRQLSDSDFELAYAKAKLNFMDKKSASKLVTKLQALEGSLDSTSGAALIIAEAAMVSEDYTLAKKYLSKAIKTSKIDANLLRVRGDIAYHRLESETFAEMSKSQAKIFPASPDLQTAIEYFEDALMLDEMNQTSNLHLLSLLGRSDAKISEAGLKSAERSYRQFLKPYNVGEFISVANVLARAGKTSRACDNYRYAKGRVDGYKDTDVNDDFARLKRLEQAYPQLCG